jgi:hypothetical protein
MTTQLEIPRFGELLRPFLSQVPVEVLPRFLALLERAAADRYREWAAQLPEFAEQLHACADSEDQISDHIEAAFDLDPALHDAVHAPLAGAVDTYRDAFAKFSVWDQLRVQANAERQGAQAWRNIAMRVESPEQLAALAHCSALEEASADALDALIQRCAPVS